MTDIITPTTILTTTHSVGIIQLSSGNMAMVEYQVSVGDVVIWVLLTILIVMQAMTLWREWR
jgi:hypothetical protein